MPWTCPDCNRTFKHINQSHSCVQLNIEVHFLNKHSNVKKIYEALLTEIKKNKDVRVNVVKNAIIVSSTSTFLALKPKKSWIDLEFLLEEELNDFPIHKTIRVSKNRVAHFVRLEHPEEIDKQLLNWLKRSCKLVNKK